MWRRDEQRAAHALDQYLHGVRVRAIATELNISPATVRRWITAQLTEIAAEERAARVAQLQAAIESQRAILRAAWVAYHREQTREDQRLAATAATAATARPDTPSASAAAQAPSAPPTRANHAASFLRLAGVAQREIARLQGLYTTTTQQQPATDHVTFTLIERPYGPQHRPPDDYLPDTTPAAPDATLDAHTAQLAQTAQLSAQLVQTAQLSATGAPATPATPATPNPPLTHRSRQRLRYLQSLQQQPFHHLWALAYSGP